MSLLHVYSASAGSGKTHHLTGECLSLLISQPDSYRHILAVTFTNKASEEMKERVLHELYNLASGTNSDYIRWLCNANKPMNEETVRAKATDVLNKILHDYSRFSYMTIDSFFQRILRNFMRELNLNSNFELELDSSAIVSSVVDQILEDTAYDEELLGWVLEVVSSKMEETGSWDFRKELIELFDELFKEKFAYIEKIYRLNNLNRDDVKQLVRKVAAMRSLHESTIVKIGQKAETTLLSNNLTVEHFYQKGKGAAGFLLQLKKGFKEPNTFFNDGIDNEDKFIGKSSKQLPGVNKAYEELNILCKDYKYWFENYSKEYLSSKEILKNIYLLGLIIDGKKRLATFLNENDRFFIGDTPLFLAAMAEKNDAPFIFEKAGIMLNHYLIDEFQDTSEKQWEAFLPLLKECISYGNNFGLVVGDVKQSIFRWRNGSWRILAQDIDQQFRVQRNNLGDNWRSLENIVVFNNYIFDLLPKAIQDHYNEIHQEAALKTANRNKSVIIDNYKDAAQNAKAGSGGYVNLKFFGSDIASGIKWDSFSMQEVIDKIDKLLLMNYTPGDLAILVRTHAEAKLAAQMILDHQSEEKIDNRLRYPVVSSESLKIAANPAISVITGIMKFLLQPQDTLSLYSACINYLLHFSTEPKHIEKINSGSGVDVMISVFPAELKSVIENSTVTDIITLSESIISVCKLNDYESSIPFIDSFIDIVAEFSRTKGTGLHSFIEWWESDGTKKSLQMPDTDNAVRILTIHQAKGLGFEFVFIPFCNFILEPKEHLPLIWANTEGTPYDTIPFIPLKYSSTLGKTQFNTEYFDEKINCYLDKLNLAYVAFTRAKKGLFIHCPQPKSDGKEQSISKILQSIINETTEFTEPEFGCMRNCYNTTAQSFELGGIAAKEEKVRSKYIETSHPVSQNQKQAVTHGDFAKLLRDEENADIELGITYHKVFEYIRHSSDVDKAVHRIHAKNLISAHEKQALSEKIKALISQPQVKNWFTEYSELHSEKWILAPNSAMYKPDRVIVFDDHIAIVDYKFGKIQSKNHIGQVYNYMELLSGMGYKNIKGYVWYVFEKKLIEINMGKNPTETDLEE